MLAGASNLAFDLVDVKGLERHGPAGKEVELGEVLGEQVGVFGIDIVAPLNLPAFFFDDANGIVVFNAGKRKFGDDHLDQFLALFGSEGVDGGDKVLRFLLLSHRLPDVVEHALEHAHHVVVVGP